jgi:hypothetical protein
MIGYEYIARLVQQKLSIQRALKEFRKLAMEWSTLPIISNSVRVIMGKVRELLEENFLRITSSVVGLLSCEQLTNFNRSNMENAMSVLCSDYNYLIQTVILVSPDLEAKFRGAIDLNEIVEALQEKVRSGLSNQSSDAHILPSFELKDIRMAIDKLDCVESFLRFFMPKYSYNYHTLVLSCVRYVSQLCFNAMSDGKYESFVSLSMFLFELINTFKDIVETNFGELSKKLEVYFNKNALVIQNFKIMDREDFAINFIESLDMFRTCECNLSVRRVFSMLEVDSFFLTNIASIIGSLKTHWKTLIESIATYISSGVGVIPISGIFHFFLLINYSHIDLRLLKIIKRTGLLPGESFSHAHHRLSPLIENDLDTKYYSERLRSALDLNFNLENELSSKFKIITFWRNDFAKITNSYSELGLIDKSIYYEEFRDQLAWIWDCFRLEVMSQKIDGDSVVKIVKMSLLLKHLCHTLESDDNVLRLKIDLSFLNAARSLLFEILQKECAFSVSRLESITSSNLLANLDSISRLIDFDLAIGVFVTSSNEDCSCFRTIDFKVFVLFECIPLFSFV